MKKIIIILFSLLLGCKATKHNENISYSTFTIKYIKDYTFHLPKTNQFLHTYNIEKIDNHTWGMLHYPLRDVFFYDDITGKISFIVKMPEHLTAPSVAQYCFFNYDSIILFIGDNYKHTYDSAIFLVDSSSKVKRIYSINDPRLITSQSIPNIYNLPSSIYDTLKWFLFIRDYYVIKELKKVYYTYSFLSNKCDSYKNIPIVGTIDLKTGKAQGLNVFFPDINNEKVPKNILFAKIAVDSKRKRFYIYFKYTPIVYVYDYMNDIITDTIILKSTLFEEKVYGNESFQYNRSYYGDIIVDSEDTIIRSFIYQPNNSKKRFFIVNKYSSNNYKLFEEMVYKDEGKFPFFINGKIYKMDYNFDLLKLHEGIFNKKNIDKDAFYSFLNNEIKNVKSDNSSSSCKVDSILNNRNNIYKYLRMLGIRDKDFTAIIFSIGGCHSCNEVLISNIRVNQSSLFSKGNFYLVFVAALQKKSTAIKYLKENGIKISKYTIIDTTSTYSLKYNKSVAENPRLVSVRSNELTLDTIYQPGHQIEMIYRLLEEIHK